MRVDDIFRSGLKHLKSGFPCEDYSLSGVLENSNHGFLVVSDGCSGANGMTDVAARLWCLAYLRTLKKSNTEELFLDSNFVLRLLSEYESFPLLNNRNDETASLNMLLANNKTAQCLIFGDGGYSIEKKDGIIILVEFNWYKNRPYYPILKLEDEIRGKYSSLDHFRNQDKKLLKKKISIFKPEETFLGKKYILVDTQEKRYYFEDVEFGYLEFFDRKKDNIDSISIYTDGLWSIQKNNLNKIVKDVMSLKDIKPSFGFLKHKMADQFEMWRNKDQYPFDDFSMATLLWKTPK